MPATPRISVTLNEPRGELLKDGFGESKTAGAAQCGEWKDGVWRETALPKGVWKEPSTGILMLKPHVFRPDWRETEQWGEVRDLMKSLLDFGDPAQAEEIEAPTYPRGVLQKVVTIAPKRSGTGSALVNLMVSAAKLAILADLSAEMVWWAGTKTPLKRNEGWSIFFQPTGLFVDRTDSYAIVSFGGKFFMELTVSGEFSIWYNDGTDTDEEWRLITRQSYKDGSVDHTQAFQVTVIPCGPSYLSIQFSQVTRGSLARSSAVGQKRSESSFLLDLAEHGIECPFADDIYQNVKTPASTLYVGLPPRVHTPHFLITRVAYAEETLDIGPIAMPEPKQQVPTVQPFGYADVDGDRPEAPKLEWEPIGHDNTAWDAETHHRGTVRMTLTPSPDQTLSPEVWYYDVTVPEVVYTPEWTPTDASQHWTFLRLQMSARSEASSIEVKFHDRDHRATFHRPGPISVKILGNDGETEYRVFDGYLTDREPTPFGPVVPAQIRGKSREEVKGQDMFSRLEQTLIARSVAVDGKTVAELIRTVLNRAGFTDAEIDIEDPALEELYLPGTNTPDDLRTFNADTYVADVIRDLQRYVSAQASAGLRIRWENGKWRVYFAWEITPGVDPYNVFFLDRSLLPEWDTAMETEIATMGDTERWQQGFYAMTSEFEPNVGLSRFNALEVVAKVGDPSSDQSVLCYIAPHPDMLENPASPMFEGRLRTHIMAPPETTGAQDVNAVEIWARTVYDLEQLRAIQAGCQAEWQPEIAPDQNVLVVGRAPGGTPCSYGYWRIEQIDVEITRDHHDEHFRTDWEWSGSYHLIFQKPSGEEVPFAMVTSLGEDA